jgi:HAD superfamily hydrolase (TIGR01549 family)
VIKAVVFDLDGTLVYLPINYQKLFQEFKKVIKTENVRPITRIIARLDRGAREKVFAMWDEAELEVLPQMTVRDEGMKLYRKFSAKSKALVTMQGRKVVEKILKAVNLSFNVTITREWSLDRIEQLGEAVNRLHVTPEEVLFIGDTENDKISAEKVGCNFLKVT